MIYNILRQSLSNHNITIKHNSINFLTKLDNNTATRTHTTHNSHNNVSNGNHGHNNSDTNATLQNGSSNHSGSSNNIKFRFAWKLLYYFNE